MLVVLKLMRFWLFSMEKECRTKHLPFCYLSMSEILELILMGIIDMHFIDDPS
jgi:hypothetical protein